MSVEPTDHRARSFICGADQMLRSNRHSLGTNRGKGDILTAVQDRPALDVLIDHSGDGLGLWDEVLPANWQLGVPA